MDLVVRHQLARRLRRSAWPWVVASARRANRDLDAMVALFETRPRAPRSSAATVGVRSFLATLAAQQIPADTLADAASAVLPCGC